MYECALQQEYLPGVTWRGSTLLLCCILVENLSKDALALWFYFRKFPSIFLNSSSQRALQQRHHQSHTAKSAQTFLTVYNYYTHHYQMTSKGGGGVRHALHPTYPIASLTQLPYNFPSLSPCLTYFIFATSIVQPCKYHLFIFCSSSLSLRYIVFQFACFPYCNLPVFLLSSLSNFPQSYLSPFFLSSLLHSGCLLNSYLPRLDLFAFFLSAFFFVNASFLLPASFLLTEPFFPDLLLSSCLPPFFLSTFFLPSCLLSPDCILSSYLPPFFLSNFFLPDCLLSPDCILCSCLPPFFLSAFFLLVFLLSFWLSPFILFPAL